MFFSFFFSIQFPHSIFFSKKMYQLEFEVSTAMVITIFIFLDIMASSLFGVNKLFREKYYFYLQRYQSLLYLLAVPRCLLGLLLDTEVRGGMFLRNACSHGIISQKMERIIQSLLLHLSSFHIRLIPLSRFWCPSLLFLHVFIQSFLLFFNLFATLTVFS
jgi:hypothetical protein